MEFWNINKNADGNSTKILIIPNITNKKNLEKDSFIDVIEQHINGLNGIGNYYFHIVLPKFLSLLDLSNVQQHIVDISGDILAMRVVFPIEIKKLLKNLDYDLVYNHNPDWFQVSRFTQKPVIGYGHWFELKSCNAEDRLSNFRNLSMSLLSISRMEYCYLNTEHQKNEILEEASTIFNTKFVHDLDKKLIVWNLGVDKNNIVKSPSSIKKNIIVFNHRCIANKGYPNFMKLMNEYRDRRSDFSLWLPQSKETNLPDWISTEKLSKKEYYTKLQECKVGVQMRQTHFGWSIAATDCMMNGTSVLFQEQDALKEIHPNANFFKYKKDFFNLLDKFLDDDEFRYINDELAINRSQDLSLNNDKMFYHLHDNITKILNK